MPLLPNRQGTPALNDYHRKRLHDSLISIGAKPPEKGGVFEEAGEGIVSGAMQVRRGLSSTLDEMGFSSPLQAVEAWEQINQQYQPAPDYEAFSLDPANLARTITTGITQAATGLGLGVATTALTGSPLAGGAVTFASTFGQIYGEEVKDFRKDMSDDDAQIYGLVSTIGQSLLESVLGPERIVGGLGKTFMKKAVLESTKKFGKSRIKQVGIALLKGGLEEGSEEVLQDILSNAVASAGGRKGDILPSIKEIANTFTAGALPGLILGGGMKAIQMRGQQSTDIEGEATEQSATDALTASLNPKGEDAAAVMPVIKEFDPNAPMEEGSLEPDTEPLSKEDIPKVGESETQTVPIEITGDQGIKIEDIPLNLENNTVIKDDKDVTKQAVDYIQNIIDSENISDMSQIDNNVLQTVHNELVSVVRDDTKIDDILSNIQKKIVFNDAAKAEVKQQDPDALPPLRVINEDGQTIDISRVAIKSSKDVTKQGTEYLQNLIDTNKIESPEGLVQLDQELLQLFEEIDQTVHDEKIADRIITKIQKKLTFHPAPAPAPAPVQDQKLLEAPKMDRKRMGALLQNLPEGMTFERTKDGYKIKPVEQSKTAQRLEGKIPREGALITPNTLATDVVDMLNEGTVEGDAQYDTSFDFGENIQKSPQKIAAEKRQTEADQYYTESHPVPDAVIEYFPAGIAPTETYTEEFRQDVPKFLHGKAQKDGMNWKSGGTPIDVVAQTLQDDGVLPIVPDEHPEQTLLNHLSNVPTPAKALKTKKLTEAKENARYDEEAKAFDDVLDTPDDFQLTGDVKGTGDIDLQRKKDKAQAAQEIQDNTQDLFNGDSKFQISGVSDAKADPANRIENLKKALPYADVEQISDTEAKVTLPNGTVITVQLVDNITTPQGQEARGSFISGDNVIQLSQNSDQGTIDHEVFHAAKAIAGITESDQKALDKVFNGDEEAEAEAYRKYQSAKRKPKGAIASVFDKIKSAMVKMAKAFGYNSKNVVFDKIATGKVFDSKADNRLNLTTMYQVDPKVDNYKNAYRKLLDSDADAKLVPSHFGLTKKQATQAEIEVEGEHDSDYEAEVPDGDFEGTNRGDDTRTWQETLIEGYRNYLRIKNGEASSDSIYTVEGVISNMRSVIQDVKRASISDLSDRKVLNAVKDLYDSRQSLFERMDKNKTQFQVVTPENSKSTERRQANPFTTREARAANEAVQDSRTRVVEHKADVAKEAAKYIADRGALNVVKDIAEGGLTYTTNLNKFIIEQTLNDPMLKQMYIDLDPIAFEAMSKFIEGKTKTGRMLQATTSITGDPVKDINNNITKMLLAPSRLYGEAHKDKKKIAMKKEMELIAQALKNVKEATKSKQNPNGVDALNLTEDQTKDSKLMAKVMREIATTKAPFGDKMYEFWINSILSGFATHFTNVAGNSILAPIELSVQRSIEATINLIRRDPKSATFGEISREWGKMLKALKPAYKNMLQAWDMEMPTDGISRFDNPRVAIRGKWGRIVRGVGTRPLLAADEFAKTLIIAGESEAFAYRQALEEGVKGHDAINTRVGEILADPNSDVHEIAHNRSLEMLHQQEAGGFVRVLSYLSQQPGWVGWVGKFVYPFIKTPANITRTALRKTPLGGLKIISDVYKGDFKGDRSTRAIAEQIMAWGAVFSLSALMGGDDDEILITGTQGKYGTNKARWERENLPPTSIKVYGTWIDYSRIQPFGIMFGLSVDGITAWNMAKGGETEAKVAGKLFSSMRNNIIDQTFLSGLNDVLRAFEEPEGMARYGTNFLASWVPNVYRGTVNKINDNITDRRNYKRGTEWFTEQFGTLVAQKAGFIKGVPKITIWGEDMPNRNGLVTESPFLTTLWRAASPMKTMPSDMDKADQLIMNWNLNNPNNEYWPSMPSYYYRKGNKTIYFDSDEYHSFSKRAGQSAKAKIDNMIRKGYLNYKNPTKRDVKKMRNILSASRRRARKREGL